MTKARLSEQAKRLWRPAVVSAIAFIPCAVLAPATAVDFEQRSGNDWEYLLLQALYNPFALAELVSLGLFVNFALAGILCFAAAKAKPGPG